MIRVRSSQNYKWLAEKANLIITHDLRAIEAVDGDRVLAMVGYDGWTPNSCCMHVVIEEPIAVRRLIGPAFAVPFLELGKGVVLGSVLSTNAKALALDLHLGFREVARLRDAWKPGIDMILLEMRREDCRWLKERQ